MENTRGRGWGIVVGIGLGLMGTLAACTIKSEPIPPPEVTDDPTPPRKTTDNATLDATFGPEGKDAGASDAAPQDVAPKCLGDDGPDVACEDAGACGYHCDNYKEDYKRGLAREIMQCLYETSQMCTLPDTCADKTLAKACPDLTVAAYCKQLVDTCDAVGDGFKVTQAECEKLATGLNAKGRENFAGCVTDWQPGSCKYDSMQCVWMFK